MANIIISSPNGLNDGQGGYAIVNLITQEDEIKITFSSISFTFNPEYPQGGNNIIETTWYGGPNDGQPLNDEELGPEEFYGSWTLYFDNGCNTEATPTTIGDENSIADCDDITFTITTGNPPAPTVQDYPQPSPGVIYGFEGQSVVNYIDIQTLEGDNAFQIAPDQTGVVFNLDDTVYNLNFVVPTQEGYANASGIITCPVTFTDILDYIDCSDITALNMTLSGDQGAPYSSGTISNLPAGWTWTATGDFGDEGDSGQVTVSFTWPSDYYTIEGGRINNSIDCTIPVNTTALPFDCPANVTISGGTVENLGETILLESIALTNSDGSTYQAGTVTSISPSEYTVGSGVTYTLSILIADGYVNAGTVTTQCTTSMTICATDDIEFQINYGGQP